MMGTPCGSSFFAVRAQKVESVPSAETDNRTTRTCAALGKATATKVLTSHFASQQQQPAPPQDRPRPSKIKMKTAIVTVALIGAATIDSTMGLAKYLDELPNGSSFSQSLGHPGDDSSKLTDFATAFAAAGHTWSATLCAAKFPGSTMTNGAAFGDPCCTWKKGGTPDFTVTAFTTSPTKATTCASSGGASSPASSSTTSTASSSAGATPTSAPSTGDTPAATPAAETPAAAPSTGGGCAAKPARVRRRD